MAGIGGVKPKVGRGDSKRFEDLVDMVKPKNNKWFTVRILPNDVLPVRQHWINIIAGKDKREIKIPKYCVAFDTTNEETPKKGVKCPYCDLAGQTSSFYLANVIVRSVQDDMPKRRGKPSKAESSSGFKEKDSDAWTPVQVLRITAGLAAKIQGLKDLNKVKGKTGTKTFDVSDAKYGVDINLRYNSEAAGNDKWQIQMGERTPLTEDEQAYLVWELTEQLIIDTGLETPKQAAEEIKRMKIVTEGEDDDDEDDEDDDIPVGKGKKKPAGKKPAAKKSSRHDDDDDEDDEDEDEEDEEEDEPPKKSSKRKPVEKTGVSAKSKKKSSRDDDDDEEDEDEDEEDDDEDDEDESPKSKKRQSSKTSKKSSRDDDEDEEDDDDEDEDDEDEEDEPPKKSSKKPTAKAKAGVSSKKRSSRDEDDDEDDDDEDDEDDDEPPKKSSKKPAAKKKPAPKKSSKKSRDDDDEDDEDDDSDDDDEDDDEPF